MKRVGFFFVRSRRAGRRAAAERILPLDERGQQLLDLHRRQRAARGIEDHREPGQ